MKSYGDQRCAIYDPKTEELITDENEILATTLKYNIGVLTKSKVATQDLPRIVPACPRLFSCLQTSIPSLTKRDPTMYDQTRQPNTSSFS